MTKPIEKTKKKQHYKLQECPYCHKSFRNLKNHILLKHQTGPGGGGDDIVIQDAKVKKADHEPAPTTKQDAKAKKADHEPASTLKGYYCLNCGEDVSKGDTTCKTCGVTLAWGEIA